jgi:thioredoxin reductase (NADPH)
LYGADWCPDCQRAKAYLQDNYINFQYIEVDKHSWVAQKVEEINNRKRIIPSIFIGGKSYANPDNAVLKNVLNIGQESEKKVYDSIIVGAGAAGLTAFIYIQRDRFSSLILEKKNIGGNAFLTQKIENYPGFTDISGPKLMERMAEQAKVYGATIETGVEVKNISKAGNLFQIDTNMDEYQSKSVVLALGSTYRKLGITNEEDLIGLGIHFCATCDGAFYRDKEIIVIGGGDSALEEGIFLASFCKKVTIVNRGEAFTALETYIEKLPTIKNIETHLNKESLSFTKNEKDNFKGLQVKNRVSGEVEELPADGAFIFVGLIPNTSIIKDNISLNRNGFIITTGLGETSVEGIFAAGDCREGAIAQVAAATGEGVLASYSVRNHLK